MQRLQGRHVVFQLRDRCFQRRELIQKCFTLLIECIAHLVDAFVICVDGGRQRVAARREGAGLSFPPIRDPGGRRHVGGRHPGEASVAVLGGVRVEEGADERLVDVHLVVVQPPYERRTLRAGIVPVGLVYR